MANIQKQGSAVATLGSLLASREKAISKHLAGAIDTGKFLAAAMMCVRKDKNLQRCTPASFYGAVEAAASVQLFPGATLGHAYLVPYGKECTFILGYKGMIALIQRCGARKAVSRCVFASDEFEVLYGSEDTVVHRPAMGDRGEFVGAYAIILLKTGENVIEWMSAEEINAIRDRSPASRKGPWKTDYLEMARKTPLRRAFKWMPVDPGMEHFQEAAIADEYEDANLAPRDVEVEVVEAEEPESLEGLADELEAEPEEKQPTKPAPKPKAKPAAKKEPEPEPEVVEYDDDPDEQLPDVGLPRIPWDDDDGDLGGYPLDVRDMAATLEGWIDNEVAFFSGATWRSLTMLPEDAAERIKLSKLVKAGAAKYRKTGTVEPLAACAAIVEAVLDAKEEQG